MSIEILALLTAGCVNPMAVGGRASGNDRLSKSEIAGLLAGLTNIEMAFAQAKFMGDEQSALCLVILTRQQTQALSVRAKWKVRPYQVIALADIATQSALSSCKCRRCGGVGHKLNKACLSCNGTGLGHESARAMADAIGVDEAAYRRNWKDKLSLVLAELYDLEASIRHKIFFNSLTTSAL